MFFLYLLDTFTLGEPRKDSPNVKPLKDFTAGENPTFYFLERLTAHVKGVYNLSRPWIS